MSRLAPDREWWSAQELADARLPDLPSEKRRVNEFAKKANWQTAPKCARRRAGRGGGWEFHWSLLPARAQQKLLTEAAPKPKVSAPASELSREDVWTTFEALPGKVRSEAAHRLKIIQQVELLQRNGQTRFAAVAAVAALEKPSERTIFNWLKMIEGVRDHDRLAYLAPKHRTGKKKARATALHPEFKAHILADYLRPEQPSLTSVYDRCVRIAEAKGWDVAPIHTVSRWIKKNVSPTTLILARKGFDALMRATPAQIRDKSMMSAMEGVNGDFHRFDVFVRFPAGPNGEREEIARPQMCAFQDLFSGKLLATRLDRTPNSQCVQLTLGDMIEEFGIPQHVLLDNGREFAAKSITGGSKTRYRFKIKDEDPSGLLTALGCDIHWALPYSGQSKPIERAFRDLCDRVAKHPAFAGAYTGNRPDAKPDNYGNAAVPLDVFEAILAEEIAAHNARPDRRSEVAYGRSFDDVFNENYAVAPIRKATAEQRRLWLMGAEGIKTNTRTGQINFMRNRYYDAWLSDYAGERVVIRFDRDDLHAGVHVYSADDAYLGFAKCSVPTGFFSISNSKATAKAYKAYQKARKEELKKHLDLAKIEDVARGLAELAPEPAPAPEATVIRPVFEPRPKSVAARVDDDVKAMQAALVADLDAHRKPPAEETERERFSRACELERMQAAGTQITEAQQQWLAGYQRTPDYRTMKGMAEDFGAETFAKK